MTDCDYERLHISNRAASQRDVRVANSLRAASTHIDFHQHMFRTTARDAGITAVGAWGSIVRTATVQRMAADRRLQRGYITGVPILNVDRDSEETRAILEQLLTRINWAEDSLGNLRQCVEGTLEVLRDQ